MIDLFILGAGFSKAISPTMPLLTDLGEAVRQRLDLDPNIAWPTDNVEKWLTYLSQNHPWLTSSENLRNRGSLHEVSTAITDAVQEAERTVVNGARPEWLLPLVNYWNRQAAPVITLNYDTLVERTTWFAASLNDNLRIYLNPYPLTLTPARMRTVQGGNQAPINARFRLIKLHGSVNWYSDVDSNGFYRGQVYYTIPSATWGRLDWDTENQERAFITDREGMSVPPLTEKTVYFGHETLRGLWKEGAHYLRNATRVFCIGYSLPVSDVTMQFFLEDNKPQDQVKFYVVNRDADSPNHFRTNLPNRFEVVEDFVGEDAIPRLVTALSTGTLI